MYSSKAARVSRSARKPSRREALAVDRTRPQRSRSSSWGESDAIPDFLRAKAARSTPNGGISGACSLPASSSSFDSGSAPGAAMLYAPAGPRLTASRIASTQSDRKSTRLNSSHGYISYAVFCLKKKKNKTTTTPTTQKRYQKNKRKH